MILGEHCPLCTYWGFRLFQSHGYWVRECQSCSHRWAEIGAYPGHVDRVYDDSYFTGGGAGYPDYTSQGSLLREHGRRYAKILSKYRKPGTVLDVGAAAGFILRGMVDVGWTGVGVEPNEAMAAYGRDHLGVQVFGVALEEYATEKRFDVVTMVQVLPHFVDPKLALKHAGRLSTPDGYLLVETWNCRSWMARLLGKRWHEYSPPSVLHWFSPSTVLRIAEECGFEEIASGHPKKLISGAHVKSIVRHKTESLALRPLRVLTSLIPGHLNLPYPAEDLFWVLFRKKN